MKQRNQNTKIWTENEVEQSLNEFNDILLNNTFLIDDLKKKFLATSAYCLSMLPEEEDIYEILVNGTKIVNLEFNKHANTSYITNVTDIDEYIKILNNEAGKSFFRFAKKIGIRNTNI
ncbi:hypothetical protein [Kingella denitrificans]